MASASPPILPSPAPRRRWLFLILSALIVGSLGIGAYFVWFRPKPVPPQPDMTAAMAANVRGIGFMEQFNYPAAEKEFAEALRIAPDWLPARINLGIALFNQQPTDQKELANQVTRAQEVFNGVLACDADNKHAHYCLGMIALYVGQLREAHEHFANVNRLDPEDAHTWLRLGTTHPDGPTSAAARDCFEKALQFNPYLNEARYRLAFAQTDPAKKQALLAEHEGLSKADLFTESRIVYAEMGKYADVIGRDPTVARGTVGPLPMFEASGNFRVTLTAGARWATATDLAPVSRAARERFGGTIVLFDFNGDGRPDVFLASAAVEGGKLRDLLLRNDGDGAFTDVTAAAGLVTSRVSLAAAAGDFDNDGKPDLVITDASGQQLFRNAGNGTFEDVTATAGLDKLKGVCLGCGWIDIDQDGDLDLVVCKYAADAVAFIDPAPGGEFALFENVGVAPPAAPNAAPPGLSVAFRRSDAFAAVASAQSAVAFVATDIDSDRDADLLLLPNEADASVVANDRLMRFRRNNPPWTGGKPHRWNGGLVLDANHDERSDLFLIRADGPPVFLLSKGERDFTPGNTNSPPLRQAAAADVDMDGWPDVVGLAADGKPTLLHNRADGRLEHAPDAFGPVGTAHAVAAADLDGDGMPDLLAWNDAGLQLHRNLGNGNSTLLVAPTGRRDRGSNLRTNADGIGAWVVAQTGIVWTGAERTTVSAGLGQSLLPTALGIGRNARAEVVRVRWPDAVIQAELGVAANTVFRLSETNRKGTSCPVLMAWDGEKFAFVTDFLGGGALGESGPDGSIRPPRPEESVKIEPHQLVAKNGRFLLKIAEPMDEVLYLDHLQLIAIDHPADAHAFPDERFVLGPPEPSQQLLAFRTRHFPKVATDHNGRDVMRRLLERDRWAVDGFALRSWLGYAEDHSLTLDFGELPVGGKWFAVLAGWTEYPYPESIYAATRAGVALKPPVLERLDAGGKWSPVCDLGFPAGLPRVMTRPLPADFRGGRLRISTNMQVYWDQFYLAQAEDASAVGKVTTLGVSQATLVARGFMQEVYPEGRPPVAYDDAKTEPVAVTRWKGHLTRLGDVTELLRAADDRFVLCGPGDEIVVAFDANGLPELARGWERSFVLRTRGYCKDNSTTTVTGGAVGPLPFRRMVNYPDFGTTSQPETDAARWHTRPVGAP
jgi:cytochrome c-type biogenesis protein CcmH/NrfG